MACLNIIFIRRFFPLCISAFLLCVSNINAANLDPNGCTIMVYAKYNCYTRTVGNAAIVYSGWACHDDGSCEMLGKQFLAPPYNYCSVFGYNYYNIGNYWQVVGGIGGTVLASATGPGIEVSINDSMWQYGPRINWPNGCPDFPDESKYEKSLNLEPQMCTIP